MAFRGDLEPTITPDATTAPFATSARLDVPSVIPRACVGAVPGGVPAVSQRFLRCVHCGLPHALEDAVCSITGRPIEARRAASRPSGQVPPVVALGLEPSRFPSTSKPSNPSVPKIVASPKPSNPSRPRIDPMVSANPNASPSVPSTPFEGLSPAPHRVGQVLGAKYRTLRVLGEGGMGTVYECEHLALHRKVAVKLLHPSQVRKKASVARFHHEAQVAGAIGHPNICEIYDMGETEDGAPFLVMELLQGETLADRIASEGALPFDDVIDVIVQVLSGLVAAHDKAIIHRDIKPENVFMQQRTGLPAMVKLLDFGISKVAGADDLHLTRTGMVMGTPFYMSPEQARGDRALDHRVDIYATGVMMYECLTGRRPFLAPNYNALLVQILTTSARPPREIRPAIPLAFEAVVAKAMSRDREKRFASAAEMQREVALLRDPAAMRRAPSAPPDPVPLVQPRRDHRADPATPSPGPAQASAALRNPNNPHQGQRDELPAISLDIEGGDLMDSASNPSAQLPTDPSTHRPVDSSSIEIPIVAEAPITRPYVPPPGAIRRAPAAVASVLASRANSVPPPSPARPGDSSTQPPNEPAPASRANPSLSSRVAPRAPNAAQPAQPAPPRPAFGSPSRPVAAPPRPRPAASSTISTPTPTPVEAAKFFAPAPPAPVGPTLDAPYLDDGDDADPTEVGSLPVEARRQSEARRERVIEADSTERIEPPWLRRPRDGDSIVPAPTQPPPPTARIRPSQMPFDARDIGGLPEVESSARDPAAIAVSSAVASPFSSPSGDDDDDNPTTLFQRKPKVSRRRGKTNPGEPRSATDRAAADESGAHSPAASSGEKTPPQPPDASRFRDRR